MNLAMVALTITQKLKKIENYHGTIDLDGISLDYNFNSLLPITQKRNDFLSRDTDELRLIFQLNIWAEDIKLQLGNEEYEFFFNLIFPRIIRFLLNSDMKQANRTDVTKVYTTYKKYSIGKPLEQFFIRHKLFIFEIRRERIPKNLIQKMIA